MKKIVALFISGCLLGGCTHPLHVKNIYEYKVPYLSGDFEGVKIGLASGAADYYEEALADTVAVVIEKYGVKLSYPYDYEKAEEDIDYFVVTDIQSEYAGSGWNFLINFPGFLLWAPKWHGYKYMARFNVYTKIMDMSTLEMVDEFNIPIELEMRQSEIDRTWTEISWLEWGVIAFIGGIYSVKYDEDVTPVLMDTCGYQLSEYIAAKILEIIG